MTRGDPQGKIVADGQVNGAFHIRPVIGTDRSCDVATQFLLRCIGHILDCTRDRVATEQSPLGPAKHLDPSRIHKAQNVTASGSEEHFVDIGTYCAVGVTRIHTHAADRDITGAIAKALARPDRKTRHKAGDIGKISNALLADRVCRDGGDCNRCGLQVGFRARRRDDDLLQAVILVPSPGLRTA